MYLHLTEPRSHAATAFCSSRVSRANSRGRFNRNPQTVGVELTNPVTFNCVMVHLTL